jgi:hypothetical protein
MPGIAEPDRAGGGAPRVPAIPAASRWWSRAAWIAVGAALYAVILRISYGARITSDGANSALQAWDLIHGHLLLHGWIFGDATFYSFELPVNGVTEFIFGLGPQAAHAASALAYFIVAVLAVALAVAGSRGAASTARGAVVITVLTVPLLAMLTVWTLVEEPDHPGTSVFVLLPALLMDQLANRKWTVPLVGAILAAGGLGDATVTYVAVPAIVVACGYRALAARRFRCLDAAMTAAAVGSVPLEMLVRAVMTRLGGYQMVAPKARLAPPGLWSGHVPVTWQVIRYLFGAVAQPDARLGTVGSALGLLCLAAVIAGLGRVAWTWRRASRAEHVLAAVIVVNLAVYVVSLMPEPNGYREIAAVLPCGAVLAARALVPATIRQATRALAVASAAGLIALVPLSAAATRPYASPALGPGPGDGSSDPTAPLTSWLEDHRVAYGISGYWSSSIITLQSGGEVAIRAITLVPKVGGHGWDVRAPYWETNSLWLDPSLHDARYVIAQAQGRDSPTTYEKAFGKPTATYRVAAFVILQYPVNLLREIQPMLGIGVGPKS